MFAPRNRNLGLLALILLGAVAYLVFDLDRAGRKEVIARFEIYQGLLADQSAHEAESYLRVCAQNLLMLAALPSVRQRDPARMPVDFQAHAPPGVELSGTSLLVVDETGAAVFPVAGSNAGSNYAAAGFFAWARQPEHQGEVYVSSWSSLVPPHPGQSGSGRFFIATPLWQTASNAAAAPSRLNWGGVLVMTVDLESILARHLPLSLPEAKPARLWIMDQDGTVLLQTEHPEMERENIRQKNPACLECHRSFAYVETMLAVKHGSTSYQLEDQPKKLATFAPVAFANAAWIVVVNAPQQEVTGFVRRSFQKVLLLLGLLAAAFGLGWLSVYRSFRLRVQAEEEARQWQEKHQLEEQLRQAEACYHTLFEQSPWGILTIDPASMLPLEFNPAAHRALGYSREEFARLRIVDYEAVEAPEETKAQIAKLVREGRTQFETQHRTKQGQLRNVEVSAQTLELAGRMVLHCSYHDITERKRTEAALQERAQLAALEAAVGAVLTRGGTLAEMLRLCGGAIVRHLDAAFARIWTLNEREQMLELQASAGIYTHLDGPHGRVPVGQFKIGLIAEERKPHLTNQVVGDPRVGDQEWAIREGMVAFAGYPLLVEDRLVGVVAMFARHAFTDTILQALASISNNIAVGIERKRAEADLQRGEREQRQLARQLETEQARLLNAQAVAKVGSWETDLSTLVVIWSQETYRIFETSPDRFHPTHQGFLEFVHPDDRVAVEEAFSRSIGQPETQAIEHRLLLPDGRVKFVEERWQSFSDDQGRPLRAIGTCQDITARRQAQAELENLHQELVKASRQAGMAEVATNVLHNVGNVLNGVNISTGLIVESVKQSRASSLARVVVLLREHAHDLGAFMTADSRGKHLPAYLARLSEHLLADQAGMVSELDSLRRNVEHIKEIVAMQQSYATVGGVKEMVNVVSLVEDSLRINEGSLSRHRVAVIREFAKVPLMNVEKHKILQILVNLVRNAKYACDEAGGADKQLTLRVTDGDGRVKISVIDNGVGIPPENLTRIFNHGFTTRKDGHGFGLHSGALAAKEMGGSLTVHSDGPGQGATFTLDLPVGPAVNDLTPLANATPVVA